MKIEDRHYHWFSGAIGSIDERTSLARRASVPRGLRSEICAADEVPGHSKTFERGESKPLRRVPMRRKDINVDSWGSYTTFTCTEQ